MLTTMDDFTTSSSTVERLLSKVL